MEKITTVFSDSTIVISILSFCSFYITHKILPVIIRFSSEKNLMAEPVNRSSHVKKTPNLGGIGIFISFILCVSIAGTFMNVEGFQLKQLFAVIGASLLLFIVGIKDDLVNISPFKKLFGQFAAASIIVFIAQIKIESFHGLLNIGILENNFSVYFSLFLFLFFINAYNLIDGVDGLAGVEAIIASFIFGTYFVLTNNILPGIISFVLLGSLVGFLCYNLSEKNKIFMGDSGSLFIGMLLLVQAFLFLNLDLGSTSQMLPHKIILVLAVFAFPILDTIRVFFLRAKQGKSPFEADRNHLHHKLLDLGLSHINTTIIIAFSNITLILLTYFTTSLGKNIQLLILVPLAICLFYFPFLIKTRNKENEVTPKSFKNIYNSK